MLTIIERENGCPVCGSPVLVEFLKRERVPVHQNLILRDPRRALEVPRGDLSLAFCRDCGFVFNNTFDLDRLSYGEDYDNTQTCSPAFRKHLDELVRHLVSERGVRDRRVIEVGCGRGLFLRKLVEAEGSGNSGYGFDPSYVGPLVDLGGRLRFEKRFYGPDCADIPADVVVCRHVIEHVPDPVGLLRAIRQALADSPDARVFFETPSVEWVLRNQVIWDFFYEHCSYFTAGSLTTAFEVAGFEVQDVRHVFGGQYLWLEASVDRHLSPETTSADAVPDLAERFAASERRLVEEWKAKVRETAAQGKVALWGAGAKGVTFANLVDPERQMISCLVDLNPEKQGRFVPGTGHPIVGYEELPKNGVTHAILMNPNYREENMALLQEADLSVELV